MRKATLGNRSRRRAAFTLLELIVVITIIGILGTLVVLRVSWLPGEATKKKTISDLKTIIQAAEIYRATHGAYPQSLEDMKKKGQENKTEEPFLRETLDRWEADLAGSNVESATGNHLADARAILSEEGR